MLKKYVRISLICLFFVALAGLVLRAIPVFALPYVQYDYLKHAHSHLAFLGWVFFAFYALILNLFLPEPFYKDKKYKQIFGLILLSNAGMFIAFCLNGYGGPSIVFLTLHTFFAYAFFVYFFKDLKKAKKTQQLYQNNTSLSFLKMAVFCFVLSSIGPFFIPFIKMSGKGDINNVIQFYLHFHYNGWFLFGILALFYRLLENNNLEYNHHTAKWQFYLLGISIFPAYFLNIPSVPVPAFIKWLSSAATVLQIIAVFLLVYPLFLNRQYNIRTFFNNTEWYLLLLSFFSLFFKELCQLISILPIDFGFDVHQSHFLLIAYLHLLFLGCITPFLLALFSKLKYINFHHPALKIGLFIFLFGFFTSEVYLFSIGLQLPILANLMFPSTAIFLASIFLFTGIAFIVTGNYSENSRLK